MVAIHSNYIRDRETCKLSSSTPFEVDHNLILHVNGSSVCECRVKPLIDKARINSFRRWEILSCFNKLSGEFDDGTGGGGEEPARLVALLAEGARALSDV